MVLPKTLLRRISMSTAPSSSSTNLITFKTPNPFHSSATATATPFSPLNRAKPRQTHRPISISAHWAPNNPPGPPEFPLPPQMDPPSMPPEVPRPPDAPELGPLPPADPPPVSPGPNPGPDFPGPPMPSQPGPDAPGPPLPSPPGPDVPRGPPDVYPPSGPDIVPPRPKILMFRHSISCSLSLLSVFV